MSNFFLGASFINSTILFGFPPPIKLTVAIYNLNIVESGVKHSRYISNFQKEKTAAYETELIILDIEGFILCS
jgi:hypothetical protein